MHNITPESRNQLSLSLNLEDRIEEDNPIRLIDLLVEMVVQANPDSFTGIGEHKLGRKSYSHQIMLKLYLYGYLNGICSSRKLEKECSRNIEIMWLLSNLRPDHKTISDYRKNNRDGIGFITLSFRRFLKDLGYIDGHTIAYDGTKLKAYASRETIKKARVDERLARLETELERYLDQMNNSDDKDDNIDRLNEQVEDQRRQIEILQDEISFLKKHSDILGKRKTSSYAPADTDARVMKGRDGNYPGFNMQAGVDSKHHMIVQSYVTDNVNDLQELKPCFEKTVQQLDITPQIVIADSGYSNMGHIREIEAESPNTRCYIPVYERHNQARRTANGITFTYNSENNTYTCSKD